MGRTDVFGKGKGKGKDRDPSTMQCFNCDGWGHPAFLCGSGKSAKGQPGPQCAVCKGKGHGPPQCSSKGGGMHGNGGKGKGDESR